MEDGRRRCLRPLFALSPNRYVSSSSEQERRWRRRHTGVFEKGGPRPTDVCTCSGPCLCAPPPPLAASLAAAAVRIWGLEKGRRQEQEEKGLKKMRDTMSKKWGALFRPTYCPSRPPRVEPGSSGSSGASRRRPIVHLARRDPEERRVFQERRDVYLLSCRRLFFV